MKKGFSIVLVIVFGLSLMGSYPVFNIIRNHVQRQIKFSMKNGIPEDELCRISFGANKTVRWVHREKEFWYQGEMFDVVKMDTVNGVVTYICISDKKETSLFRNLQLLVKKQMNDPSSPAGSVNKLIINFLMQLFFPGQQIKLSMTVNTVHLLFDNRFFLDDIFPEPDYPPPNLF